MAGMTLVDAVARIRAMAHAVFEAAEKDDIEPDGPLGNWVRVQQSVLFSLADMVESWKRDVGDSIENVRELAVAEVHRLRRATDLAVQTTEGLKAEREVLKLKTDQAVADFMKSATPALVAALGTVAVVKERQWNRRQNLIGVGVATLALCFVFGAGFLAGGGNFQGQTSGVAAKAAVQRCREAARADRTTGQMWCPTKSLDESS